MPNPVDLHFIDDRVRYRDHFWKVTCVCGGYYATSASLRAAEAAVYDHCRRES